MIRRPITNSFIHSVVAWQGGISIAVFLLFVFFVGLSDQDGGLSVINIVLLVITLLIVTLFVQASYRRILARRVIDPLRHIVEVTRSISEGASSGRIKMPEVASAETASIAEEINRLAKKAVGDVDEMKRMGKVRSEFIGNVSHELRTPIFSVQGYLETLLDGAVEDPDVRVKFLEKAYQNALRLNTLLNDLIEISRIESGDLKLSLRYFDISGLIGEVVQSTEIRASQRKVELIVKTPSDELLVYGDKGRLAQVVTNLVDNAIKYNVEGGSVIVSASQTNGSVEISVTDTGIGISSPDQSRIFERFYRVDQDRSREIGGTGLGLAIVKHILDAHEAPYTLNSVGGFVSIKKPPTLLRVTRGRVLELRST